MMKEQSSTPSTSRTPNLNLALMIALARAYHAVISQVEGQVNGFDLTLSEFGVLEMIFHQGPQPVQAIAEKILVTSGTMTYVINSLINKGLVERQPSQRDRRVRFVHLTHSGLSMIAEVFPQHTQLLDQLLAGLEHDTKKGLVWGLVALKDCVLLHKSLLEKAQARESGKNRNFSGCP